MNHAIDGMFQFIINHKSLKKDTIEKSRHDNLFLLWRLETASGYEMPSILFIKIKSFEKNLTSKNQQWKT